MLTEELYIDNQLVDLGTDSPIALTMQVNNMATIADRQSTYSNTIKLPKTANNKKIFGYADSDAFTQNQPYAKLKAKLVQTGVEVIPVGQANLQSATDNFEIQMTYGLSGFLDIIGNYKLTDLDWSDIPVFNWDLATIVASHAGTGILWPVVDYGGTTDESAVIDVNYLRPALFIYQIMQHIQNFAQYQLPSQPGVFYKGYTFRGSILSDSTYLNDWIPLCDTKFFNSSDIIAVFGDSIRISNNIPDISIKDFLKDFMQRYFLTPVVDNVNRTVTFKSFDELYANKSIAKDWTAKFIDDSNQADFVLGEYAQSNPFSWTLDEPYLDLGEANLIIDNQTLPQSKDPLRSIFANTNFTDNVLGVTQIARIVKYKELPHGTHFPFDVDTGIRILTIRTADAGFYLFTDGISNSIATSVKYGFFSTPTDPGIGWEAQFAKFGTGFKKLINKVRVVTKYAILTPLDVANFNFFIPVYDAKEAKYYYVNVINNYVQGNKIKIQLIRM